MTTTTESPITTVRRPSGWAYDIFQDADGFGWMSYPPDWREGQSVWDIDWGCATEADAHRAARESVERSERMWRPA